MNVALLVALLIPTQVTGKPSQPPNTKIVQNAALLFDTDWSDGTRVLSLRRGKDIESGEAWFFRFDGARPQAWDGKYEFSKTVKKNADSVQLKICFTRDWTLLPWDDRKEWQSNRVWEGKGMLLEILLDDDGIPKQKAKFHVLRGFPVDKEGREIVKPRKSYFDRTVDGDEKEKAIDLPFAKVGDLFQLSPSDEDFIAANKIKSVPLYFTKRAELNSAATTKSRSAAAKQNR